MAKLDRYGNLDYGGDEYEVPDPKRRPQPGDPDYVDPSGGGSQGITDPGARAGGVADPNDPAEIDRINGIYGPGGTALNKPGPTSVWDPVKEAWNTPPAPESGDDELLAFISQLAGMPGADPSLAADPDYWFKAISSRGGLNAGNRQYWQDAAVGPTAFFNNPNRETGGGAPAGGGGSTAAGAGNGNLSGLLMQLLSQGSRTSGDRSGILSRLMSLADQYAKPVSPDDPNIKASTDAYAGQVGRSVNRFRKTAAERAYAEGVPTGAFDAQIGNAEMAGGRAQGDFESGLMRDEMVSRRNALMSTLQSAGSLLSAQDSADIQSKIANMDAILRSQGLDVSNRGLDIQQLLGMGSLDLQKLLGNRSLDNQGRQIDNQNNQFYDQFGADQANKGTSLDEILASLLLNG